MSNIILLLIELEKLILNECIKIVKGVPLIYYN